MFGPLVDDSSIEAGLGHMQGEIEDIPFCGVPDADSWQLTFSFSIAGAGENSL